MFKQNHQSSSIELRQELLAEIECIYPNIAKSLHLNLDETLKQLNGNCISNIINKEKFYIIKHQNNNDTNKYYDEFRQNFYDYVKENLNNINIENKSYLVDICSLLADQIHIAYFKITSKWPQQGQNCFTRLELNFSHGRKYHGNDIFITCFGIININDINTAKETFESCLTGKPEIKILVLDTILCEKMENDLKMQTYYGHAMQNNMEHQSFEQPSSFESQSFKHDSIVSETKAFQNQSQHKPFKFISNSNDTYLVAQNKLIIMVLKTNYPNIVKALDDNRNETLSALNGVGSINMIEIEKSFSHRPMYNKDVSKEFDNFTNFFKQFVYEIMENVNIEHRTYLNDACLVLASYIQKEYFKKAPNWPVNSRENNEYIELMFRHGFQSRAFSIFWTCEGLFKIQDKKKTVFESCLSGTADIKILIMDDERCQRMEYSLQNRRSFSPPQSKRKFV
ncbi:uncharacterized protein LOC128959682 [Oppia nitens]|uniref:uncharacterized protein LOC128959682 n=1 Tax=Oppia nitens TaxID=1686743 RepID=UPI0023DC6405|nr:uncharacterized protein LOC128959682 [Oppia nitens]